MVFANVKTIFTLPFALADVTVVRWHVKVAVVCREGHRLLARVARRLVYRFGNVRDASLVNEATGAKVILMFHASVVAVGAEAEDLAVVTNK